MRTQLSAMLVATAIVAWTGQGAEADERYYKWRDARGQWHYSNVPSPSVTTELDLTGTTTTVVSEGPSRSADAHRTVAVALERHRLRQARRDTERALRQIDAFFASLRELQRERLARAPVHDILEDWQVADRARELRASQARLRQRLAHIRESERKLSGGLKGAGGTLAPLRVPAGLY
jgi:hypothetical protein